MFLHHHHPPPPPMCSQRMSQTQSGVPIVWRYYEPFVTDMLPKHAPTDARDPVTRELVVVQVWGGNFGVERRVMFGGVQVDELPGGNHSYLSFTMGEGQGIRDLVRDMVAGWCPTAQPLLFWH
jgi:hypothetical protein